MPLFIVPTPIGNLGDITYRAIETLQNADVILCEDTRTSSVLLNHYNIKKPITSYHQHNEHKILQHLIEQLAAGKIFALITDAGTPGISDPGYLLIRECFKNDIKVDCLPGASAVLPALLLSGFPSNRFAFEGFLPLKKGRQTLLRKLVEEDRTLVIYESPHRLVKTLQEFSNAFGAERNAAVCRELTKKFEEVRKNTLSELVIHFEQNPPKGEIVIVVEGLEK